MTHPGDDPVRRAIDLIAADPSVRGDDSWDRYVYLFYVGSDRNSGSGFRYADARWTQILPTDATSDQLNALFRELWVEGNLPLAERWKAFVITYDRAAGGIGGLHRYTGEDAERWRLTPETLQGVAEAGWELCERATRPSAARRAIAAVADHIRTTGIDYSTTGLVANRFESGWEVYEPVHVDTNDPMAFLDMPVGSAVFLIGDSGRIEQSSTSQPPRLRRSQFASRERALAAPPPLPPGYTVPAGDDVTRRDDDIRSQVTPLLDDVARTIAQIAPPGWLEFRAEFALTVRAHTAVVWFATRDGWQPPQRAPEQAVGAVHRHRELSARMSAGPWWRLILTVSHDGVLSESYDYGDEPFPAEQLQPAQHYRDDIAAYPRPGLPVWLAAYVASPAAQGRDPQTAQRATGRTATPTHDLGPLHEMWARWAVLAAVHVGARSEWGPRITSGRAEYESDTRSGSTLVVLPGGRAVLSGGWWRSPLLAAAYQQGHPLPDLYAGAPAWVDDAVLNTRNRNGLLSFCYWLSDGQWWRGGTDTFDELDEPLPVFWTPDETVDAMTRIVGPDRAVQCRELLVAAEEHRSVTAPLLASVFADFGDPDVEGALQQLRVAGLAG